MAIYEISDIRVKWILREFVSPMGRAAVTRWREDLSVRRRVDLDTFLRNMIRSSRWEMPDFKSLSGQQAGFHELRWRAQGVPHRIGGYLETENEFVMLIGWTHDAKKYDPPSALDTLLDRAKKLKRGEGSLHEFNVVTGR
jgi:hypothetical protein